MEDRRPTSNRAAWVWPAVAFIVSTSGAAALFVVGLSAVTEHYDGITSWLNVVTIGSCCAAVILILMALPLAWFTHEALRRDTGG